MHRRNASIAIRPSRVVSQWLRWAAMENLGYATIASPASRAIHDRLRPRCVRCRTPSSLRSSPPSLAINAVARSGDISGTIRGAKQSTQFLELRTMTYADATWLPPPAELTLAPDDVHIWRAALDLPDGDVARLERVLAPDELRRARALPFPARPAPLYRWAGDPAADPWALPARGARSARLCV